jgi:hypothetical protein
MKYKILFFLLFLSYNLFSQKDRQVRYFYKSDLFRVVEIDTSTKEVKQYKDYFSENIFELLDDYSVIKQYANNKTTTYEIYETQHEEGTYEHLLITKLCTSKNVNNKGKNISRNTLKAGS